MYTEFKHLDRNSYGEGEHDFYQMEAIKEMYNKLVSMGCDCPLDSKGLKLYLAESIVKIKCEIDRKEDDMLFFEECLEFLVLSGESASHKIDHVLDADFKLKVSEASKGLIQSEIYALEARVAELKLRIA